MSAALGHVDRHPEPVIAHTLQDLLDTAFALFLNLYFASDFSCANLSFGMISIATKRITTTTSMSMTSTKAKKTIFASGAWRNS